jgi:hypothetical protein
MYMVFEHPFPPTSALSPRERETASADSRQPEVLELADRLPKILPLPEGEGRGEGEQAQQISNPRTLCKREPESNVIQLRQLLAERFPGICTHAADWRPHRGNFKPTGLAQLDAALDGGLGKGALTEIVAERAGAGGTFLLCAILRRAVEEGQLSAFVDGSDSLDVTQFEPEVMSRLLWVRCRGAAEAMKATDLILRDGNLPLVLLDLAGNPAAQFRDIPATTWYRLQRLIEQTSTICVTLTPRVMVAPAQARIFLRSRFGLDAMEREMEELVTELKLEAGEEKAGLERKRA